MSVVFPLYRELPCPSWATPFCYWSAIFGDFHLRHCSDLGSYVPQQGTRTVDTKTVLFACVHNAGRSQMAAAFFNALANPAAASAISAGTQPAEHVHSEVIAVMREAGIDLGRAIPRRLTDNLADGTNLLITMGCGEACPIVPGARRQDWPLPDPK